MNFTPEVGDKVRWVPVDKVGVVTRQVGTCCRIHFADGKWAYVHKSGVADEPYRVGEFVRVIDGGGRRKIIDMTDAGYAITEDDKKEQFITHGCLLKAIMPKFKK